MKKVVVLPTLLTLGNLLSGYAAIAIALSAFSMEGLRPTRLEQAALLVFLAMIFDVLDGSVARLTRSASRFGTELDSLADLTSFGVAPAVLVLVFLRTLETTPHFRFTQVLVAAYVGFGALRLARYNVEASPGHRRDPEEKRRLPNWYFAGLPIPAAAGTVVSFVLFLLHMEGIGGAGGSPMRVLVLMERSVPFAMLLIGLLMVSRVPYIHAAKYLLARRHPFTYVVAIVVTAVLILLHYQIMLFAAFATYVFWGAIVEAVRLLPRRAGQEESADEHRAE